MTIVVAHLTNAAYGFPRGKPRRIKPVALACVHVTGNSRTAAYTDLHAAAWAERNYANRSGSDGPSAHWYGARDGWAIRGVDPDRFAAWSNGDIASPNTANPGIRRVLAMKAKGYSANEGYWEEFELLGFGSTYPVTDDQRVFVAERLAARSRSSGLPINRETVHGHWEINGVDRRNCPVPYAGREKFLADLIARANRLLSTPEDPDMPGLNVTDFVADPGTVQFRADGLQHAYVQINDRDYILLPAGEASRKPTIGRGRLDPPLPGGATGADRATVRVIAGKGIDSAIALTSDIDFKATVVPVPEPVDVAALKLAARQDEYDRLYRDVTIVPPAVNVTPKAAFPPRPA